MSPRSRSWRFPRAQATTLPTSTARGICKESSPRFRGQKMFMGESRNKSDERKPGVALTRREWLMSLGSAVVLSGFRGAPGLVQADSHPARAPLPPGLYEPSLDHLSHALDSKGAFLPIRPGALTEYARPHPGPFVPQAFTEEEFAVVRRLVEIILGEDLKNASERLAPGAPASIYDEVAEWIDLVDRKSTRLNSSHEWISYAVFCLKKKNTHPD